MALHPGSQSLAIGTLQEAGFAAPDILHILEQAEYSGRTTRNTGPYTYVVTFDGEAGYQVTREGEAAEADPAADYRIIAPSHHGSDGQPPANPWRLDVTPVAAAPAAPAAPAAGTDTVLARDVQRGWYMAGVGAVEHVIRDGRLTRFVGAEGKREFGTYTLVEVTRPAPVMWNADWPYPEFTPAEFAAHYQLAAEIITARGYNAEEMRGYEGEPGVSICTALKLAARERAQAADPEGIDGNPNLPAADQWEITAANVAEELETRLGGVIYTLGLLHARTGISDFSDQLAAWELGHYTTGPNPARSDALGLLAAAAGIFTHVSDTQAEVTAPAVPE